MATGQRRETRLGGLALLPLVIPVLVGLIYLALFGAPISYIAINAGALLAGTVWILSGRLPQNATARLLVSFGLVTLLALPLISGPHINGIARWIPIGGFTLHVGMLIVPTLCVLSASLGKSGSAAILFATLIAFAQPDTASALALALASIGIWVATRDWTFGAVGTLGSFAALGASFQGDLPPQPFVEQILPDLWSNGPFMAVAIIGALLISFAAIFIVVRSKTAPRFALAGALGGFVIAAMLGNYPYPLVGYGVASILGFALALARSNDALPRKRRKMNG